MSGARGLTVGDVVRYMLPFGSWGQNETREGGTTAWQECPKWPPDLFAVAATLAEKSNCYALDRFMNAPDVEIRAKEAQSVGKQWADGVECPPEVRTAWQCLLAAFDLSVVPELEDDTPPPPWFDAVLRLIAFADEASYEFGWVPDEQSTRLAVFAFQQIQLATGREASPGATVELHVPHSLCANVPPETACVQPKSSTPQLGCTLRSLTHNLALLPGRGVVKTIWSLPVTRDEKKPVRNLPLNMLLVPFPYTVNGADFHAVGDDAALADGLFTVRQSWLDPQGGKLTGAKLAEFVLDLVREAETNLCSVDAVVFPELALTRQVAEEMAGEIARRQRDLHDELPPQQRGRLRPGAAGKRPIRLVICGIAGNGNGGCGRNDALIFRLSFGEVVKCFAQGKHHRWKLDGAQIRSYHLGDALHPHHSYWEHIALHPRLLDIGLNRNREVIAALVCEDLARTDPVMPALSALGPNLVVALLMDGPQLAVRWPGRYATVLAEDPGASVLTLTSLGMVRRAREPGRSPSAVQSRRSIALWREPGGETQEIDLPQGCHAVALSLAAHHVGLYTLDRRWQPDAAVRFTLSAACGVTARRTHDWLAPLHDQERPANGA